MVEKSLILEEGEGKEDGSVIAKNFRMQDASK